MTRILVPVRYAAWLSGDLGKKEPGGNAETFPEGPR